MKRVIISVTNDLSTDQRVDKVANSLSKAGFSVLLVGRKVVDSIDIQNRLYPTHRFSMHFSKGFCFYLEYNIRLLFFLLNQKCDILLANDLDTLCANYLVSRFKNIKLVYDSHELFTELPELIDRPFIKFIWSSLESFLLKRIHYSYTVSDSISNYYKFKYDINMSVISNFPLLRKHSSLSYKNKLIKKIIYQGAVNKDRGIDLMIQAMLYVDAELHIVGDGDMLEDMKEYVNKLNLNNKVLFAGRIDFNNLFEITKQADLGLSFEKDTCLSYRYSLPNKIFDYIHAGIPVLVSDLPEFKNVINNYSVGMLLKSRDVRLVASQINDMLSLPKSHWSAGINIAKENFCWQNQEVKLLSFFSKNKPSL